MRTTVVVTFPRFSGVGERVAAALGADLRYYSPTIFKEIFSEYKEIVAIMATGIVVRHIAPLLRDKWTDPAVVVVSHDLGFAIPIIGGHHGANDLAKKISGIGAIPVITTGTEIAGNAAVEVIADRHDCDIVNRESTVAVNATALDGDVPVYMIGGPSVVIAGPAVSLLVRKGEYAVGIGCRKGVAPEEVIAAVKQALGELDIGECAVRIYATTTKKWGETGLRKGVELLGGNLVYLDDEAIAAQPIKTPSRAILAGLPGVAEPCALAVSGAKELVMEKRAYGRVTISIAK
jgi:cobalt-precorrin 5A hydrolase